MCIFNINPSESKTAVCRICQLHLPFLVPFLPCVRNCIFLKIIRTVLLVLLIKPFEKKITKTNGYFSISSFLTISR